MEITWKESIAYGENAKRLLESSPNTPSDIKLSISQLTMVQYEKKNQKLFLFVLDGLNKPKNHFTLLSL